MHTGTFCSPKIDLKKKLQSSKEDALESFPHPRFQLSPISISRQPSTLQTVLDLQGQNLESIYKVCAAFQVTTVSLKDKDLSKDPITGNKRKLKI